MVVLLTISSSKCGEKKDIKINEPKQSYSSNYRNFNNINSYNNYNSNQNVNNNNNKDNNNNNNIIIIIIWTTNSCAANDKLQNSEIVHLEIVQYMTQKGKECLECASGKYTYKVCSFDKVIQNENWHCLDFGNI
ncbi:hypothetical protein RFI_24530 [Reticulomyxa filosa]|uniref:Uncharacterized protein n=1 Tax=Reticulomyxa filosa TaxID=46433 RepID=X6MIG2_RETFI|nr:hypothetical protein RFI_24530 [Reticulomyxa filosa]|eukprot:ETO12845.1 hypothetical protein RFI_24530 [Reticulomyxa filosa]